MIDDEFDVDTDEGMANAVQWQKQLLSSVKEGGAWAVPRSGNIFVVHHKDKSVTRIASLMEDPVIDRVIKAAGWIVREQ